MNLTMKRKHICQGCGKEVTLRYQSNNKYSYPHKCPHGKWCRCGMTNIGLHNNHSGCPDCDKAKI